MFPYWSTFGWKQAVSNCGNTTAGARASADGGIGGDRRGATQSKKADCCGPRDPAGAHLHCRWSEGVVVRKAERQLVLLPLVHLSATEGNLRQLSRQAASRQWLARSWRILTVPSAPLIVPTQLKMLSSSGNALMPLSTDVCVPGERRGTEQRGAARDTRPIHVCQ